MLTSSFYDDAISENQSFITVSRTVVAVSTFCCYEWLITLSQEIDHIWARRWTLSTWIFASIRYSTFLFAVMQLLPSSNYMSCLLETRMAEALMTVQFTALAGLATINISRCIEGITRLLLLCIAFTALRTCALCNRNIWVFLAVFGFSIVPAFVDSILFYKHGVLFGVTSLDNFCESVLSHSIPILFITRASVISRDCIALSVTWWKTLSIVREAARLKIKVPLAMVLIREGTLLTFGLLILHIFQLLSVSITSLQNGNPGIVALVPMSATLVCRFILDLKQAAYSPDLCGTLHMSTIRFNTDVLNGNLEEPLDLATEQNHECVMEGSSEVAAETP
ncbi:hypothetical protein BC629DRAFT_1496967 [Irpex lacteus]|nr:hypothetical protein BC629DRAFT_1496967 [Irpex lacteus]